MIEWSLHYASEHHATKLALAPRRRPISAGRQSLYKCRRLQSYTNHLLRTHSQQRRCPSRTLCHGQRRPRLISIRTRARRLRLLRRIAAVEPREPPTWRLLLRLGCWRLGHRGLGGRWARFARVRRGHRRRRHLANVRTRRLCCWRRLERRVAACGCAWAMLLRGGRGGGVRMVAVIRGDGPAVA